MDDARHLAEKRKNSKIDEKKERREKRNKERKKVNEVNIRAGKSQKATPHGVVKSYPDVSK